jgi:hypothetical protein
MPKEKNCRLCDRPATEGEPICALHRADFDCVADIEECEHAGEILGSFAEIARKFASPALVEAVEAVEVAERHVSERRDKAEERRQAILWEGDDG